MNRDTHEEYEEVESPFAPSSNRTSTNSKLRTKKNVFNRPFAAEPSSPPAVFETTSRRRSVAHPDDTDLIHHRSSELSETDIDYLEGEEEEEEVEKRPARVTPRAQKKHSRQDRLVRYRTSRPSFDFHGSRSMGFLYN